MCKRCGARPKQSIRGAALCDVCHGTCRICSGPAERMSNGAFRTICLGCRPQHEPAREVCSKCGNPRDGAHKSYCRACERIRDKERQEPEHRRRALKSRRRTLRRSYNMTLEEFDLLLASQGGGCAGCGAANTTLVIPAERSAKGARGGLHVDHDHSTGTVRGILCGSCNAALGRVRDDPATLRALAAYLENPPAGTNWSITPAGVKLNGA